VPATTGTRPPAALTTSSVSCLRSAMVKVVNSPVLPRGTSPWAPSRISRFVECANTHRRTTRVVIAAGSRDVRLRRCVAEVFAVLKSGVGDG
jgi:hypothetical protein